MSMHLAPVYLSTTKVGRKSKSSRSKRLAKSTVEHDKWLKDRGLHPSQRDLQRAFKGRYNHELPDLKVDSPYELSNRIGNGFKNGIMDNLHRESPQVRKQILEKASQCAPLYSKGAYQYITRETSPHDIGKKK